MLSQYKEILLKSAAHAALGGSFFAVLIGYVGLDRPVAAVVTFVMVGLFEVEQHVRNGTSGVLKWADRGLDQLERGWPILLAFSFPAVVPLAFAYLGILFAGRVHFRV